MNLLILPLLYTLSLCNTHTFCPTSVVQKSQKKISKGHLLGTFQLTHYWLTQEKRRGKKEIPLKFSNKKLLFVTEKFARDLRLQGSGFLNNGKLIQYVGECQNETNDSLCFKTRFINQDHYPMGVGAAGVPLVPFRSIAVDSKILPLGTAVYIPALKKLFRSKGLQHDGCFIADDRGEMIQKKHLDLFVGTKSLYSFYFQSLPSKIALYINQTDCLKKFQPQQ